MPGPMTAVIFNDRQPADGNPGVVVGIKSELYLNAGRSGVNVVASVNLKKPAERNEAVVGSIGAAPGEAGGIRAEMSGNGASSMIIDAGGNKGSGGRRIGEEKIVRREILVGPGLHVISTSEPGNG